MERTKTTSEILSIAFKAVAIGVSVAAIVLDALGAVALSTLITLLAIGLFCLAVTSLK